MIKPQAGFTIVELVVVIAIIGILSAITVVSYRGSQAKAQDTAIKTAAQQMADAIQLWSTRTNQEPGSAIYSTYAATSTKGGYAQAKAYSYGTPEDTLVETNYLPPKFSEKLTSKNAPYGNNGRILMYYPCSKGRYAVYAALNDASGLEANKTKATEAGCPLGPFNAYNSNYIVIF